MAGAFIPLTHVKSPLKSLFWENSGIFVDICSLYYYTFKKGDLEQGHGHGFHT